MERTFSPAGVVAAHRQSGEGGRAALLLQLLRNKGQPEKNADDLRKKFGVDQTWKNYAPLAVIEAVVSHEMGAALERYISELDAKIAMKLAELCPGTTFCYLLLPGPACRVGNTLRMAREQWPGCTGVYAVFTACGDERALLMIDKMHLRIVRTLVMSVCATHITPYTTLAYNTLFVPVTGSRLVAMKSVATAAAKAPHYQLMKFVSTSDTSFFWGVYTLAHYVATVAIPRQYRWQFKVPLPAEKGFGLMASLPQLIISLTGDSDAKFQKAIRKSYTRYGTRSTLYSCMAAFVARSCRAYRRGDRASHIMKKKAVFKLNAQLSCDAMCYKFPMAQRIVETMTRADVVKRAVVDKHGASGEEEFLTVACRFQVDLDPVFYIYEFLTSDKADTHPKLRKELLLAISLDTAQPIQPVKKAFRGQLLAKDRRCTAMRTAGLSGKNAPGWVEKNYWNLWDRLDARHPMYTEMAVEPSWDSPTIVDTVFKFYGYTWEALRLDAKKVCDGASLDTRHKIDTMALYRDTSAVANFPVFQGDDAHAKRLDYRHFTAAEGRKTLLRAEDCFLVLDPDMDYFTRAASAAPQFVLAEAHSGHGEKYFEAVEAVLGDSPAHIPAAGRGVAVGDVAPRLRPPQQEILEVQAERRERKRRKAAAPAEKEPKFKDEAAAGGGGGDFSAMLGWLT